MLIYLGIIFISVKLFILDFFDNLPGKKNNNIKNNTFDGFYGKNQ